LRLGRGTGQFLTADPDGDDRDEQGEQPDARGTAPARACECGGTEVRGIDSTRAGLVPRQEVLGLRDRRQA
jgi:hypothetical protein